MKTYNIYVRPLDSEDKNAEPTLLFIKGRPTKVFAESVESAADEARFKFGDVYEIVKCTEVNG